MPYKNKYNMEVANKVDSINKKYIEHLNNINQEIRGGSIGDMITNMLPYAPLLLGLGMMQQQRPVGSGGFGYASRKEESGVHDTGFDGRGKGQAKYTGSAYLQSASPVDAPQLNIEGQGKKKRQRKPKVNETIIEMPVKMMSGGKKKRQQKPKVNETIIEMPVKMSGGKKKIDLKSELQPLKLSKEGGAKKKEPSKWMKLLQETMKGKGFKTLKETIKYVKDNNLYKK
jgi:hypothetical protein